MVAPGSPAPRIAECGSLAVVGSASGGDHAATIAVCKALKARGIVLRSESPSEADVVVLVHGLAGQPVDDAVAGAFATLNALAARPMRPRLVVASGTESRASAGVEALVKTAAQEWDAVSLCLSIPALVALTVALADELAFGGGAPEVRVTNNGGREERARIATPLIAAARTLPSGVWIISGGARGITAACSLALARAGMRRVLLLGRSVLEDETPECRGARDEAELKRVLIAASTSKPHLATIQREAREILARREVRATIEALEATGASVRYAATDVSDSAAVATVVSDARRAWGPVRGLVHAAGVLADKRLGEKTAEQFQMVMRTKVAGAHALLAACEHDPLEVLCFFSSVAAHTGNPGQSDYAAANAILDRLAEEEAAARGDRCRAVSVAWGPWDGGMVSSTLAHHFTARGIGLIPVADGASALVHELRNGTHAQVILARGLDAGAPARSTVVRFDIARAPFLRDHAIDGTIVIPMTIALDWLHAAGSREFGRDIELRDITLLKGALVRGGTTDLLLTIAAGTDERARTATLSHSDGRIAYRATVHPAPKSERPALAGLPDVSATVGELPACCLTPYRDALFHGTAFRVIREIFRCDAAGISGRVATAGAMRWPAAWQLDPAALDGALQLLRVWGWAQHGNKTLPTEIARCRTWGLWPRDGDLLCHVTAMRDNALRLRGDAVFVDSTTGRVLAALEGVVMHVQGG